MSPPARRPAWQRWIRSWLGVDDEEQGRFRPVRLPLWLDLGIAAAIIVFMAGSFGGFIVFLAMTQ